MKRLLEIRTYRLKHGTIDDFHEAMLHRAVPMLRRKGTDVVAFGRSDHEDESYFLIRSYESRKALESEQNAFYGSAEWREGPRGELVSRIDTYLNTLVWASSEAVESLRKLNVASF